jgi:hypothetical protein
MDHPIRLNNAILKEINNGNPQLGEWGGGAGVNYRESFSASFF